MTDLAITCPNCAEKIKLTDSLAAPLIAHKKNELESQYAQKEEAFKKKQKTLEAGLEQRLTQEREAILKEQTKKAQDAMAQDLHKQAQEVAFLKENLSQKDEKLAAAQKAQLESLKQQREFEEKTRELDLTIEKRVQSSLLSEREKASKELEQQYVLKVSEKEEQIASMHRQIEVLKHKAEQGSQQLQGEALEIVLEETLRTKFPFDEVTPVPKGEFGGDLLQTVKSPTGDVCGKLLWESKRTKNWTEAWLPKLRNDQRQAKAEIAVLVSQTLPKNISSFDFYEGIWICAPNYALPLCLVLRQTLISVQQSKQSQQGQQTKMALVYDYLTGPRFRHRVEAIVEKFTDMQADLEREKKAMTRLWAKRDSQIHGVLDSTIGLYGDLQGIAGQALQEIEGLDLPLLEEQKDETPA